jgi:hypothetical protein
MKDSLTILKKPKEFKGLTFEKDWIIHLNIILYLVSRQ